MIITVIGAAGGVGQATCAYLKTLLPRDTILRMVDMNPAIPGIALDLGHIPTSVIVEGYVIDSIGQALSGADIVLLAAGMPRKPGMTRDDLFTANAEIVRDTMRHVATFCPQAFIAIVTNPVNSMLPIARNVLQQEGIYNFQKLCGVTMLDVVRAQTLLGAALNKNPEDVTVTVIGGHSGITILPLLSQVEGNSLTEEENQKLRTKIQDAGTAVVEAKSGAGSATLAMGYAGAHFVSAVSQGLMGNETTVCAYVDTTDDQQLKVQHADISFFAKPVILSKGGIMGDGGYGELSTDEQKALKDLLPVLAQEIEKGNAFPI